MKKMFFILLLMLLIFMIYHVTKRESTLVFSIGNQEGDIYYYQEDMHITEVTMGIERNEIIDNCPIQQILVKASTIQIDMNSFFKLTNYERILTQIEDLEELFQILRKYSKEKIEILLLKEDSSLANYANKKISILSSKYDIMITR